MRWIGIDEAGYGPNIGPLVMTAVVAEATGCGRADRGPERPIDLWGDLAATVDRAGGDPGRLWVDDSKAILKGGKGRDRLESTCLTAIHAAGLGLPCSMAELVQALGSGTPEEAELSPWFGSEVRMGERGASAPRPDPRRQEADAPRSPGRTDAEPRPSDWPWVVTREAITDLHSRNSLAPPCGAWRLAAIESVVIGPARFNAGLEASGSKAEVHFGAFARLLQRAWRRAGDGAATFVTGDKHGGRHYYLEPLSRAFPDAWIDRGPERPESSRYTIRSGNRRVELALVPKADRTDGLVALASIVSKAVRELWMDGFNAYWRVRVPGLRPTAGYPVDARRFRLAIEEAAAAEGCDPSRWWRIK